MLHHNLIRIPLWTAASTSGQIPTRNTPAECTGPHRPRVPSPERNQIRKEKRAVNILLPHRSHRKHFRRYCAGCSNRKRRMSMPASQAATDIRRPAVRPPSELRGQAMSSAFEPSSVNTPPPPPTRSLTGDQEMCSHGNPATGGPLRSLMATRRNVAHWLFPRRLSE